LVDGMDNLLHRLFRYICWVNICSTNGKGMKECKKGKHKYLFELEGNNRLLNKFTMFACIKCGMNWAFDKTMGIKRSIWGTAWDRKTLLGGNHE